MNTLATSQRRKFSPLREELRRAWVELRGGAHSPSRTAMAVSLGLFVGAQPIIGLHTAVVIALCLWLRLDAALAWLASNISNPLFAPPLFTGELELGTWLRTGARSHFSGVAMTWALARETAGHLFVGAVIVGAALALTGGAITFAFMRLGGRFGALKSPRSYELPSNAPAWFHCAEALASRYVPAANASAANRSRFHYVRVKLLSDPIAKLIAELDGPEHGALGHVLDIGCGAGHLGLMLIELGRVRSLTGIDWDEQKIADAQRAAQVSDDDWHVPVRFERADARNYLKAMLPAAEQRPPIDTVFLIDLLHYFTEEEQNALVRAAARVGSAWRTASDSGG